MNIIIGDCINIIRYSVENFIEPVTTKYAFPPTIDFYLFVSIHRQLINTFEEKFRSMLFHMVYLGSLLESSIFLKAEVVSISPII